MSRISDNDKRTKHAVEISFFNRLIIDLKLKELGREQHDPITMERLETATQMLANLEQCKEIIRFR